MDAMTEEQLRQIFRDKADIITDNKYDFEHAMTEDVFVKIVIGLMKEENKLLDSAILKLWELRLSKTSQPRNP